MLRKVNTKSILNIEISSLNKKEQEDMERKKSLTVNHLVYRSKRKKIPICESDDKHKEYQSGKYEDVEKDTKIIKCGEGE